MRQDEVVSDNLRMYMRNFNHYTNVLKTVRKSRKLNKIVSDMKK